MDDRFNLVTLVGKNADGDELFSVDATELFNIAAKYRSVDNVTADAGLAVSVTEYADRSVAIDFVTNISGKEGNTLQLLTDEGSVGLYATMAGPLILTVTGDTTLSLEQIAAAGYSGLIVVVNSATDVILTITSGSATGVSFAVCPIGAGSVSFVGDYDTYSWALQVPSGLVAKPRATYSMITMLCLASGADNTASPGTEIWVAMGDLAQAE